MLANKSAQGNTVWLGSLLPAVLNVDTWSIGKIFRRNYLLYKNIETNSKDVFGSFKYTTYENIETNSKNIFESFKKNLKLDTSIMHTNIYSHEKFKMQTQIRKSYTKITNIRFMCTKTASFGMVHGYTSLI